MKKLLSLLMLLCLTLTVAPAALAEEVVNVYTGRTTSHPKF